MALFTDIRDGLAANLTDATNGVDNLTVSKRIPSEISDPKTAVIEFDNGENIRESMGKATIRTEWTVHLFIPDNGDPGDAEQRLDELMEPGTGGVWAAIETDRTLGAAVQDCVVTGYGPYEWVEMQGGIGRYIKGSLSVLVLASGV